MSKTPASASVGKKAYPLRIDPAVFEIVRQRAQQEGRSVNRQIEHLVRQALASPGKVKDA